MEIKPKFTPGPYRIDDLSEDAPCIVGKPTWRCKRFGVAGEWEVAALDDLMEDHPEEVAANARLFRFSPDLFWFVANIAKRDPVFAKGTDKMMIADAKALISQVLG